jgi:hypothetical protein
MRAITNHLICAVSLAAGPVAIALLEAAPVQAHGWHNAALTTSSLDEWLADVQNAIPDLLKRANETELHAGRGLEDLKKGTSQNQPDTSQNQSGTPKNRLGVLTDRPGMPKNQTGTPKKKTRTLENETGTPKNQTGMTGPQRGRQIVSQLTPQQQELLGRKAEDALEALAFMDPANIFPQEFPRFDLSKIPQYRETAVKLLKLMGPVGTRAVISELRAELMGMGRSLKATDYRVNPAYYDALLKLLYEGVAVGEADAEDLDALRLATKGFKPPPLDALARLVAEALAAGEATRDTLPTLAERISAPGEDHVKRALLNVLEKRLPDATNEEVVGLLEHDNGVVRQKATAELSKRANQLSTTELIGIQKGLGDEDVQTARVFAEIFRKRIPKASSEDLLALAKLKDSTVKRMARSYLAENLRGLDVAGLLDMQQMFAGDPLARPVAAELAKRSPKYAEVKDQLEKIVGYLGSSDAETARAAEGQTANAFQRAPLRQCLRWLAVDDERLRKLIWKQIDGRIARADAERKDGYRQVAIQELADNESELGSRLAAIELMERLNDPAAAQALVDKLPTLPRELWPRCGGALRKLTRQDFGPRPGDGAAELNAALAKWRTWLEKQNK